MEWLNFIQIRLTNKLTWKGLNYVKNVTRRPGKIRGKGSAKAQTDRHLPPFYYYYYFSYHTALDSEVILTSPASVLSSTHSVRRLYARIHDFPLFPSPKNVFLLKVKKISTSGQQNEREKGGKGGGTLHRKKWKINIIKTMFIKRDCRRRILSPCRSGFCLKSWRAGNKNSNCAQARGWANGSRLTAQFSTAA